MISPMRLVHLSSFLTLVVLLFGSLSIAAPNSEVVPDSAKPKVQEETGSEALRHIKVSRSWESSTNVFVGYLSGVINTDKETTQTPLLGVQKTRYNLNETAQEFGLALSQEKIISLDMGFKWITKEGEWNDPFYKISIAGLYDPKDSIGNIVNYKRYYLRGSVGLEDFLKMRRTLKAELIAGVGYPGVHGIFQIVYAFPD